ncbi:PREDICTED: phospholipase A1-like [Eufriesea mexicana]|uniref:phospholipase A1-like n=1 Tax=Eufriesea mexicana TaxID=516756 RepID=UPI00083C3B03|nr:PREDICTED: phospholipase A1-like [Eufriesea mexicana]
MVPYSPLALIYPTLLTVLSQSNYTIFPNDEGVPYLVKLDDNPMSLKQITELADNVDKTTFTLYTQNNRYNGRNLILNDVNSIKQSNWDSRRQTIIVTHGWNSAGTKQVCTLIRDAYLKISNSNVIIVDWSTIANNIIYSQVAKSVPTVANHVAAFVNFLRAHAGLQTSKLKIIGHSLGAHIAGLSAREVSKSSRVPEVIALDPAKPLFDSKNPGERVDKTDANNVQVIHTCAGLLGLDKDVGTSDFYANGGRNQPGCSNDLLGSCAHGRSYEYYSESITNAQGFVGISENGNSKAYMGGPILDSNARGAYNFRTTSQPPYAIAG